MYSAFNELELIANSLGVGKDLSVFIPPAKKRNQFIESSRKKITKLYKRIEKDKKVDQNEYEKPQPIRFGSRNNSFENLLSAAVTPSFKIKATGSALTPPIATLGPSLHTKNELKKSPPQTAPRSTEFLVSVLPSSSLPLSPPSKRKISTTDPSDLPTLPVSSGSQSMIGSNHAKLRQIRRKDVTMDQLVQVAKKSKSEDLEEEMLL